MNSRIKISFIYFAECPHAEPGQKQLLSLLEDLGAGQFNLETVDTTGGGDMGFLDRWPSPTILVEGIEIDGTPMADERSCRLLDDAYWGRLRDYLLQKLNAH